MIKKSITIKGHRTSVTLEREFWEILEYYSQKTQKSVSQIILKIDEERILLPNYSSLSSCIRVFIIKHLIHLYKNKN